MGRFQQQHHKVVDVVKLEDDYDEDEATVGETSIEEDFEESQIPIDFGRLPGLDNLRDDHEFSTGYHTLSPLVRARRSRIPSNRNNTSEFGSNEMEWSYDEAEERGSAQGKSGRWFLSLCGKIVCQECHPQLQVNSIFVFVK